MDENRITYFGQTDARNKRVSFGIKAKDRTKHMYVIGKTGMGKSTLLENMAVQDIKNGEGMAFVDPHGKTADLLLEYIPEHRMNDVIYFAPFDMENPISFNVLENVDADKRHLVVSGLMSTFKKIWQDAWSARMEYILTNTLLALLEYPDATLLGVNRMLSDKEYRKRVVDNISDPSVKAFWTEEFAKYTERMAAEAVPAIQNKIGQFTANPLIRNMIGQPKSSFNIREVMDKRKIMIVNLSKGRIGESNANLLGGMLITKIYLGAMSRADVPDMTLKKLPNFYLFVDEFQNFANESFADILSEARKYKLNLTMAHQYIEQMEDEVRAAVFGNVGTMVTFRVGAFDAEVLEKEFAPQFTMEDIVNLGFAQVYLKLMIDGISSPPFSATTLPPIPHPEKSFSKEVIEASRAQFSRNRTQIELDIASWHQPMAPALPKKISDGKTFDAPKTKLPDRQQMKESIKEVVDLIKSGKTPEGVTLVEETVSTPQPRPRVEVKPQPKPEVNIEVKPEIKVEAKIEVKPEVKVEIKPEVKPEPQPQPVVQKVHVVQPVKPISLNELQPQRMETKRPPQTQVPQQNRGVNNKKIPTQQNVNALKDALASLLKDPNIKIPENKPEPKVEIKPEVKPQIKPEPQPQPVQQKAPEPKREPRVDPKPNVAPQRETASEEVPEGVLRDLLSVPKRGKV